MDIDRTVLKQADCWFTTDRVAGREDVTSFKRAARFHQANWREARGLSKGGHSRLGKTYVNGSKIATDPENDWANFLSPVIREAVAHRLHKDQYEDFQTLDTKRLRFDLLSSMPMCFNLFGELHADPIRAAAAAAFVSGRQTHGPVEVRFEFSPGRRNPHYLGDRTAFDAALLIGDASQPRDFVGIETKYHEHALREHLPDERSRMPRYREVTEASGIFKAKWASKVLGTDLQQLWRDHLLVLAMNQSDRWGSGTYLLVYPAGNPSFAKAAAKYRDVLKDDSTFQVRTIEDLLDADLFHDPKTALAFRERYILA